MDSRIFELPAGFIDGNGERHRRIVLSALDGKQEALLATPDELPARLVSQLIAQSLQSLGQIDSPDEPICDQLLIADREFILLKLRQMTFGNRVQSSLLCPWPDCGKKLDIDFKLSDIPITEVESLKSEYPVEINRWPLKDDLLETVDATDLQTVYVRLPNGADQIALSELGIHNPADALSQLLSRCITRVGSDAGVSQTGELEAFIDQLSPEQKRQLDQGMEAHAPNLDLTMEMQCPDCQREFVAPFQIQDFFFGEIQTDYELLLREVHYLAFHYHWSESEIMAMPKKKRRQYIDILSSEIEKLNDAHA